MGYAIIAMVDKAVTHTTINSVSRCLSFQFGSTDATARAAAAPQIETAQAVKRLNRYLLPISLAIKTLIPMDKITKIGTNNKVLVPRPEICSIVTLKPNKATPKRSIFLLENSIPGAHLSSVERKLKAIPISSANSITGAL
jgi:hypothetical protein